MIIKGNYYYPDFSKMIPNLIESFVEYYGENHREYITQKLNSVDVHFFTGLDSIEVYMSEKLPKTRDVIIGEFLDKFGVKGKDRLKVKKELFTTDDIVGDGKGIAMGDHSRLALAAFTTRHDVEDIFTPEELKSLYRYREDICSAFGLNSKNKETVNLFIQKLEDLRVECMDKLQARLGQVGHDDFSVERSEKKALVDYFKYLSSKVKLSKTDAKKIGIYNSAVLDMISCKDIYVGNCDISTPGDIFAFTSGAEKALKGSDQTLRDNIYDGRIKYFNKMGIYIEQLPNEDMYSLYNRYLELGADKFIISRRLADKLENKREFLADGIYDGLISTKYFIEASKPYVTPLNLEKNMGYIPNNYEPNFIKNGRKFIHRGVVCVDCDALINPDDILCNLIHELGHHLQHHIIDIDHKNKVCTVKESVEKVEILDIGVESFIYDCVGEPDEESIERKGVTNVLEYFNEMQAKDITALFLARFNNPFKKSDISLPTVPFSSQYDKSHYLLGDFWNGHKEEIKHECITGEETFTSRFGYNRLKGIDDIVSEFYRDSITLESPYCDYVYKGLPFSSIPPSIRDKVVNYKQRIINRVNTPNM